MTKARIIELLAWAIQYVPHYPPKIGSGWCPTDASEHQAMLRECRAVTEGSDAENH
jgi:hypothetical protein